MRTDANLVADCLITLGHERGKPLTPIEVQKLLYFLEGWHLALVGEPAFDEDFEAWKNGPVIYNIYDRLREYGGQIIPLSEVRTSDFVSISKLIRDLISRVFDTYKAHDPGALVGLTHLPGTPWSNTRESHGIMRGQSSRELIPKDEMKEWFGGVWRAALQPASRELVVAAPEDYADWSSAAA